MGQSRLSQLTRSHEWWDHKTPQILSLAYAAALTGQIPIAQLLSNAFLIIFGSLILIAIYASIINDLTDLKIDIACGKSNMMQRLPSILRVALTLVSLGMVLLAGYFVYPRIYAVIFYFCIALAISLYSFPPVRLKKRGILGVISCAFAEHMFPSLFAVTIIFYFSYIDINWALLTSAGTLSFLYGVRSILWHQFLDKENDLKSGVNTFASNVDAHSFKLKARIIMAMELIALASILFLLNLWISYVALIIYFIFILCRQRQFKSEIILVISPKNQHFQILMLDFYTIFFPLSLLIYAALTQSRGWIALLIHMLLFYKILWMTLMDTYHLVRDTAKRFLN